MTIFWETLKFFGETPKKSCYKILAKIWPLPRFCSSGSASDANCGNEYKWMTSIDLGHLSNPLLPSVSVWVMICPEFPLTPKLRFYIHKINYVQTLKNVSVWSLLAMRYLENSRPRCKYTSSFELQGNQWLCPHLCCLISIILVCFCFFCWIALVSYAYYMRL